MASQYLVSAIASRLDQFVVVDQKQLQVALWKGRVTLESVEIKPEALAGLGLPVKIEGSIHKLELQARSKLPCSNASESSSLSTSAPTPTPDALEQYHCRQRPSTTGACAR